MAHEVARLTKADPNLGPAGQVVSITKVVARYGSSKAANASARFICADCGVPVTAVVPAAHKAERARSPSAHFRAKGSHKTGCTRLPRVLERIGQTTRQMAGRPDQAKAPSVWEDPPATSSVASAAGTAMLGSALLSPGAPGAKVSHHGTSASVGHSYLVQRFAEAYLRMTGPEAKSAALSASWNPGGTYASAFTVLSQKKPSVSPTPKQIYVGEIAKIHQGDSGFVLELVETHSDRTELRLWLKNELEHTAPAGPSLWSRLLGGQVTPKMIVFALGAFSQQTSSKRGPYHSLPLIDARLTWIVDVATVQNILNGM